MVKEGWRMIEYSKRNIYTDNNSYYQVSPSTHGGPLMAILAIAAQQHRQHCDLREPGPL